MTVHVGWTYINGGGGVIGNWRTTPEEFLKFLDRKLTSVHTLSIVVEP